MFNLYNYFKICQRGRILVYSVKISLGNPGISEQNSKLLKAKYNLLLKFTNVKLTFCFYDVTVDDEAIEEPPTKKKKKAAKKAQNAEMAVAGL